MTAWINDVFGILTADGVSETIVLIIGVITIRFVVIAAMTRKIEILSETRRRWISVVQNTSVTLILLGLLVIWSPQLSALALSLAAFAVALVFATKEFILCLVGALYRASAGPFEIGDWIELNGLRGEVLHEGLLSTRLRELGEGKRQWRYTGRLLSVPNGMLLTHAISNESYRKKFMHHSFDVTLDQGIDVSVLKQYLVERIDEHLKGTRDVAHRYWSLIRRRAQADIPSANPSIDVHTTDLAKLKIAITIFCPTDEAIAIESALTEEALSRAAQMKGEAATDNKETAA